MDSSGSMSRVAWALVCLAALATASGARPRRDLDIPIDDGAEPVDSVVVKAVEIPEEQVTYEGAQVWRVLATDDKVDYVAYLQDTGGSNPRFAPLERGYTERNLLGNFWFRELNFLGVNFTNVMSNFMITMC